MSLSDLYQEIILEHGKSPRNQRDVPEATHEALGHNTLCGDKVQIQLIVKDGVIEDVAFSGTGCAISTASASMMTDAVRGKSVEEFDGLFAQFQEAVKSGQTEEDLGDLECLLGVSNYPGRVKCATLCWHTLRSALRSGEEVSTEVPGA